MRHYTTALLALALTAGVIAPASASSNASSRLSARAALLRLADFPSHWTTSPYSSSNGNLGDAQVAACLGVPTSFIAYNPPQVNSPEFDQRSTGLSVNDSVALFPNAKVLSEQFQLFSSARAAVCFGRVFNSATMKKQLEHQMGPGATMGHVTVTRSARPPGHDQSAAITVIMPITVNATTLTISMEMAIIVSKLRAATLTFLSTTGLAFPASLARHLEAVSAQRLN